MAVHRIDVDDLIALGRYADRIDLSSRRRVMTDLAGAHVSGFRGRGMDFEEHRVYHAGDEARAIDWRVTARTGTPHVRLYREERERPVMLAVDLRAPMWFGTRGCYKAVLAAHAAALCAWAAAAQGDRIGGVCVGDGGFEDVRTAGGARGALRLVHALAATRADAPPDPSALAQALQGLLRTTRPGSLALMLSDFRGFGPAELGLLKRLGRRAELVLGFVHDPLESSLPPPGLYPVADRSGDAARMIDSADAVARGRWAAAFDARRALAQDAARGSGAHWLDLSTARPLLESFARHFGPRRKSA